jgi:molecular chaperone GrpE
MAWGRNKEDKREPDQGPDPQGDAGVGGAGGDSTIDPLMAQLDAAQQQIAKLEAERDDLNSKYLRTLADYQNSQRRAVGNEREAKQQGIGSVVMNVLTVLDHFDLALAQEPSKATAESIISGVKVIRDELMKVLQNHGVTLINAPVNGEFNPSIHQAVVQAQDDNVEPGRIVATLQTGYMLGDRVIRPAMVSIRTRQAEGLN